MGVKIPSKITNSGTNSTYGSNSTEEMKNENKSNYGFSSPRKQNISPTNSLKISPKNDQKNSSKNGPKNDQKTSNSHSNSNSKLKPPTHTLKNVTFSGIACAFNGIEECSPGKIAPLALYVG